ncbi:MAG: DUF4430 domain-containing protein [Solirubrobacteraceae bacterium]|jgi:hypothetical protein
MSPRAERLRCVVRRRALGVAVLVAVLMAATSAGCGLGAGSAPTAVKLTVTRDFGAQVVRSESAPKVRGEETVMSLLMRNATVTTKYGGGFVQSIDGLSGGSAGGQPQDWFYFVNGIEAPKGAAETNVHAGDHIWWDLHDWSQTDSVPAVVGSFPDPFANGIDGKRLPLRVECASVTNGPCTTVESRLQKLGVLAPLAAISPGNEPETLRLMVGPWTAVSGDPTVHEIESGPGSSGVYARMAANGSTLTVLNEQGSIARTLGAGAGLIAATRSGEEDPVWVVTGTDEAGVELAAHAFDEVALHNRFALAITPGGELLSLPAPVSAGG